MEFLFNSLDFYHRGKEDEEEFDEFLMDVNHALNAYYRYNDNSIHHCQTLYALIRQRPTSLLLFCL